MTLKVASKDAAGDRTGVVVAKLDDLTGRPSRSRNFSTTPLGARGWICG